MGWGYRAFAVHGDGEDAFLRPANAMPADHVPLEYPHVDALCTNAQTSHRAPVKQCMCGYHAYTEMGGACDYVHGDMAWIMAEVWGHGRIEAHGFGWRSQRMQVVRLFYPLCQVNDCRMAAEVFEVSRPDERTGSYSYRQGRSWPPPLHFRCEAHEAVRAVEAKSAGLIRKWEQGEQVDAGQMMMQMPEADPATGRIDVIVAQLAERFKASVYDLDATLKIYEKNVGWVMKRYQNTSDVQDAATRRRAARTKAANSQMGLGV